MKIWDNVIIGAGFSGLILGQRLKKAGQEVLILEKAKSVGGRMATRRDGDATFDHGAQFSSSQFTDLFQKDSWVSWFQKESVIKYSYIDGMNKAAKALSSELQTLCDHKVVQINNEDIIVLNVQGQDSIHAKRIYLTCPVPQSLELLQASHIAYPKTLEDIHYAKALVGLFRLDSNDQSLLNLKYTEDTGRGIFSIANQKSKSVSQGLAFTVVMNPKFSESYFNFTDEEILFLIENCFESFLQNALKLRTSDYSIVRSQVKKWRYSHPLVFSQDLYCSLADQKIILLGDGFVGASLINAARSALAVPI